QPVPGRRQRAPHPGRGQSRPGHHGAGGPVREPAREEAGGGMTAVNGQVVVITGASGGVGRATAHAFAKRGARIALLARGEKGLQECRDEVEALGGRALCVPTDVADHEQVEAAAARAESELGEIDVWVNDAMSTVFATFADVKPEEFKRA